MLQDCKETPEEQTLQRRSAEPHVCRFQGRAQVWQGQEWASCRVLTFSASQDLQYIPQGPEVPTASMGPPTDKPLIYRPGGDPQNAHHSVSERLGWGMWEDLRGKAVCAGGRGVCV